MSEPNLQENRIIETFEEKGVRRFHTGNRSAEEWKDENFEQVYRLLGQIAVPIREPPKARDAVSMISIFENGGPSTMRRGGRHRALSRALHDEGASCNVVATGQAYREFKAAYRRLNYGCQATKRRYKIPKRPLNAYWWKKPLTPETSPPFPAPVIL